MFFSHLKKYWFVFVLIIFSLCWFATLKVKPVNEWNFGYIIPIGIFLFVLCVIYLCVRSLKVFVFNRGSELFIIGTLLYLLNEFTLGLETIRVELFVPGVTVTAVGMTS